MDFLNDIDDKESLTDAPDTRISTSMSFKVKNKEVKIETTQKYNRFDTNIILRQIQNNTNKSDVRELY